MNTRILITAITLAVLFSACSQISTQSEIDKDTDFSSLKTYRWGDGTFKIDKTGESVDRKMDEIATMVRDKIQPLVNKQLQGKGYELVKEGIPDFVVQYSAKSSAQDVYSKETYAPGAVAPRTTVERSGMMMIGTITIYILEPVTFKLLWRGEGETIIKGDEKTATRFEKAIEKIFKDFPSH